jgi:hypothetical protein
LIAIFLCVCVCFCCAKSRRRERPSILPIPFFVSPDQRTNERTNERIQYF